MPGSAQGRPSLADLDKYAGWLTNGREAFHTRAAVKALAAALETAGDIGAAIYALDLAVRKLPAGHVTTLMRKALRNLYPGLEAKAFPTDPC
jgi:hypothetical protein